MMQKRLSKLELTGSFVALACAIHCLSIPVLVSLGSAGIVHWFEHEVVEILFLVVTLSIAGWSILTNYRKKSVNARPITLFAIGFSALIISVVFHLHFLSAVGGILIATAHYFNWKALQSCKLKSKSTL